MIKSRELIPFIDSLKYLCDNYRYGEPRELYEYRGNLLMFAITALWNHQAKKKADFDTNVGEYLALMLDNQPMTDWIINWHDNVIPKMLEEMRRYLESDPSALTPRQLGDISLSADHLANHSLPAADTPEKQAELRQSYEFTRKFFLQHIDKLTPNARDSINKMEDWRKDLF